MRGVQTLGISNSTPKTENPLKRLFWPSIQNANDVDTLGMQGYWVCAIVAVFSFAVLFLNGQPIAAAAMLVFMYVGGVGVREHSLCAAAVVFFYYALDLVLSHGGFLRIFIAAVLLSTLRATWIASRWKPDSANAEMPMRFNETWRDKFVDVFPRWFWPKVRIVYYIYSVGLVGLTLVGLAMLYARRR